MPNYDNHYGIVVESEDNVKVIKKPLEESKICDIEIEIKYGEKIDGKLKIDEIKFMTSIDNCEIRAEKLWTKNENVIDIYQECNDVVVEYKLDSNDQAELITRNNIDKDTLSYKESNLSENDLKLYYSEETKEGKLPVKGMNAENVIAEHKKKGLR